MSTKPFTKTFITVMPEQGIKDGEPQLKQVHYKAIENNRLHYENGIRFPITCAINGYAEKGDRIRIIAILPSDSKNANYNFQHFFHPEMHAIAQEKELDFDAENIEIIKTTSQQDIDTHLKLFLDIISVIGDNEVLYACITYGTKPLPIILSMALNYAYRIRTQTTVGCILYGKLYPSPTEIHDTTALFYTNSIVARLADAKVKDPERNIRMMLGLDTKEDGEYGEEV